MRKWTYGPLVKRLRQSSSDLVFARGASKAMEMFHRFFLFVDSECGGGYTYK